ncbi:MAG: hypothetical protein V3V02_02780 [Rhizobiaceae bacterium]
MGKAVKLIIDLVFYFTIVTFLGDYIERGTAKYILVLIALVSVYHVLKQMVLKVLNKS